MARYPRKVDRTEVRASEIHGKGLFATERIRKGELIGRFEGPPATRNGSHVLWWEDAHGKWQLRRVLNDIRYANHSRSPNAEAWGCELWASRNIAPGEEITFDYGEEFEA